MCARMVSPRAKSVTWVARSATGKSNGISPASRNRRSTNAAPPPARALQGPPSSLFEDAHALEENGVHGGKGECVIDSRLNRRPVNVAESHAQIVPGSHMKVVAGSQ